MKNRDIILECAYGLFLEKGYRGTSLTHIMTKAELSKGAIYHHFESKEVLYITVVEEYFVKRLAEVYIDDMHCPFKERAMNRCTIVADLFDQVEKYVDYPIRAYFSFQLEAEKFAVIRQKLEIALMLYRSEVIEIINQAQKNGELPQELSAEALAMQFIGLVEGIAIHHSLLKDNVKETLLETYRKTIDNFAQKI